MPTIVLQLDPRRLTNPDLDIRYALTDLLIERSDGLVRDDGYDYVDDGLDQLMLLFLATDDAVAALPGVIAVLQSERVLDNDLSSVPVGVDTDGSVRIVHPPGFAGPLAYSTPA